LIDEDNEMVGVVETDVALRQAREAGLDLVEVAPSATPPVCRIMDFGKWKYEQAKKDKATKAKSKTTELKEVRLGRSMKIDPHDIGIRLDQARRFLMDGHKVQIVQNFRGREMMHKHRGQIRMTEIVEQMADVAKLEVPPRFVGRRITMILAPDKARIDRIKQRKASMQEDAEATEPPVEETPATETTPATEAETTPAAEAETTPAAEAETTPATEAETTPATEAETTPIDEVKAPNA
jgi:translation initiation factor IF-3